MVIGTWNSLYVTEKTSGWFTSSQDADIMLSEIDFNNTGGPLHFSHPCTVASEGTHLLLAGRNNNRVLIWDPLPTGKIPKWDKGISCPYFHILYAHINYFALLSPPLNSE